MYKSSPFHYLYDGGNTQALSHCTGFDYDKFKNLLDKICEPFDDYTFDEMNGVIYPKINCTCRPRDLDVIRGLGLVLVLYRTRGACSRNLAIIFG